MSHKFGLVILEMLENQGGQVSILTQVEEVLEMQRVDPILRIVLDDTMRDKQRLVRVWRTESVHGETTGQTSDGTEETFKRFGEVMRDEIFVDLWNVLGDWVSD